MCMVFVLFGAYQYKHMTENAATFSGATLTYGSQGEDVRELQGRLKFLGFYYGKVDGIFGSKTQGSVKWFQSEFGMTVDGVVGSKTRNMLVKATKDWKPEKAPGAAAAAEASPPAASRAI